MNAEAQKYIDQLMLTEFTDSEDGSVMPWAIRDALVEAMEWAYRDAIRIATRQTEDHCRTLVYALVDRARAQPPRGSTSTASQKPQIT